MDLTPLFIAPVIAVIGIVVLGKLGLIGKKTLPELPASGPLPVTELTKYYDVSDSPIAWERVRGWDLNQPIELHTQAPIDHVILTPRLLDFCTSASGKLTMVFNFLVGAIQEVRFEPATLPPGATAPGQGLVTVFTPSGETRLVATSDFALVLQRAVASAKTQSWATE